MSLNNIKAAILLTDGFEQVEMVKPREALEHEGVKTFLISPKKTVQGWNHQDKADIFDADVLLDEANPKDYNMLLLPGGVINPDSLRLIPEAIEFIKKIDEQHKLIAAICHGPWLLINAGIAKNRQLTSWPSVKQALINAGGKWLDEAVVKDENLITSRNPKDIPAFNEAIITALKRNQG